MERPILRHLMWVEPWEESRHPTQPIVLACLFLGFSGHPLRHRLLTTPLNEILNAMQSPPLEERGFDLAFDTGVMISSRLLGEAFSRP